jgi:hypothetical protein
MSSDIDMKSYAGERGSAAESSVVDQGEGQEQFQMVPDDQLVDADMVDQGQVQVAPEQVQVSRQEMNFKALRDEVEKMKQDRETERREYQLQIDMLRSNVPQKPQEAPSERKMFDGMQDNDVPNVAEMRREWEQRENLYQARLEELSVQQQFSDYRDVIEKHFVPLIKQKPYLAEGIQKSSNKALSAYEIGKLAQQSQMNQAPTTQPQRSEIAQRIVENARKPGTLATAGGQSVLSKADYYATMSDAEFMKMANKHLEEI